MITRDQMEQRFVTNMTIIESNYPRKIRRTRWKRLRILWLLWCLSRKHPTQRFGQIVANYCTMSRSMTALFMAEDWRMIKRLKEELK